MSNPTAPDTGSRRNPGRTAAARLSLILAPLLVVTSCQSTGERKTPAQVAEELAVHALDVPSIGLHERPVSGANAEAQSWFNQGLRYVYGFNQDAAAACFGRAALAAPECPMAWWGIAHVLNADINNSEITPEEAARAAVAAREALRLATNASPLERMLIEAAQVRTANPPPTGKERKPLDDAYAEAMRKLWEAQPFDGDVGALYAESLMMRQPWNYWTPDGEPIDKADLIVSTLEEVLYKHPNHPGANHFYIHAVESSSDPWRGIASADRLAHLMPGSGHLVHMPSHIYINVGRYKDAVTVNERACTLDAAYFDAYAQPTFYRVYFIHNLHFVAYGAMMEGRKALALRYVQRMEENIPDAMLRDGVSQLDGHLGLRLHVYIRFGMWDQILEVPEFPEFRKASRGIRRYARTVALANLGRTEEARSELARFDEAVADTPEDWMIQYNPAKVMYDLSRQVAEAELLWREGKPRDAVAILRKATTVEHNLIYTEPPSWMIPVRHTMGAIQLTSGDALGAEATYREDLKRHPENAWGLLGLHQTLTSLGRHAEADALKPRLDRAWARADVTPPASCYCGVLGERH